MQADTGAVAESHMPMCRWWGEVGSGERDSGFGIGFFKHYLRMNYLILSLQKGETDRERERERERENKYTRLCTHMNACVYDCILYTFVYMCLHL